jgi:N-acetylmuramoyl-L-alanine amidase
VQSHGGRDPGTMYGKIYEKDINLEISKILEHELTINGATVYLTREDDIDHSSKWDANKKRGDLYRRLLMMRNSELKVDLYLSVHINWGDNSSWSGAEILYHPINSKNEKLATAIMMRFKNELGSNKKVKKTDLYMYKNTTIPGVLIECGFLSNPNDRYLLQQDEYQLRVAKTITSGVIDYFLVID